jgi:hypothetical protein
LLFNPQAALLFEPEAALLFSPSAQLQLLAELRPYGLVPRQ